MIKILIACLLISSVLSTPVAITDCDNIGNKYFDVSKIEINPFPVPRGTKLEVTATGTAKQNITSTRYAVTVYLGIVPLKTVKNNITTVMVAGQTYTTVNKADEEIPSIAPPGTYRVATRIYAGDVEISCREFKLVIV